MPDASDMSLLQDYSRNASEEAFAEVVQRHVNLVYSAALRHTGIAAHAEEITQAVFVILARKTANLRPGTVLEAWLYETTRLTSLSFLRGERRRQFREQEAYMQSTIQEQNDPSTWNQFAPLLDEAMARLGKKDREAVVLRFFNEKNLREVATALNVSEGAAQVRVHRALEKLRGYFSRRGVASTTAIIAGEISAHSVQAAPAGLAKTVSAVAVAKGATASASTLTLIKGALKIMAWTNAKTAIVAGIGVLLIGTTIATVKEIKSQKSIDSQWDTGAIEQSILFNGPHIVRIIPTRFPNRAAWTSIGDGRDLGLDNSAYDVVRYAYGGSPYRTIFLTALPQKKYDFIANLISDPVNIGGSIWPASSYALQQEVKKQFGVVARYENVQTNVLFLDVRNPTAPGLRPSTARIGRGNIERPGELKLVKMVPLGLVLTLENFFKMPIVDQTGLDGEFDVDLKWKSENDPQQENLKQAVFDQLGLELVPTNMPIEMLVVRKAN